MNIKMNKKGFTLIELVIVVIVIAVMAAIAFPKLFSVINSSKMAEAIVAVSVVRHAVDTCYLAANKDYGRCMDFSDLNVDDPSIAPNAHFVYEMSQVSTVEYNIKASVKQSDGAAHPSNYILFSQNDVNQNIEGFGIFGHYKIGN